MGTAPKSKWLSKVDQAWLRMSVPTNLMVINGLLCFEGTVDFERLLKRTEQGLAPFRRFRRRVVEVPLLRVARWEDDPSYDLRNHIRRIALPAPGGEAQLRELIGGLMSAPLDSSKPLWQAWVIENCSGGSALLVRVHHCLADGAALVRVIHALTDDRADPGASAGELRDASRDRTLLDRALESARSATRLGRELLGEPSRGVALAKATGLGVASLMRLVALPAASPTLKGPLRPAKAVAWSRPIPLALLQQLRAATGATINDLASAAVSGGLRSYLSQGGMLDSATSMRAIVPVNLRDEKHDLGMGNRFGLVFLDLPVGEGERAKRVEAIRRDMSRLKSSPEAALAFLLLFGVGMVTPGLQDRTLRFFGGKGTLVMTNVQGPRAPRFFAGARVREMMFWVPMTARLGLGVSVLSYAGSMRIGICSDTGLVPDPEALVQAIEREMDALALAYGARPPAEAAAAGEVPAIGLSA